MLSFVTFIGQKIGRKKVSVDWGGIYIWSYIKSILNGRQIATRKIKRE